MLERRGVASGSDEEGGPPAAANGRDGGGAKGKGVLHYKGKRKEWMLR